MAEEEAAHVKKARGSKALPKEQIMSTICVKDDYDCVLQACARNVKMGPWKATSGVELEYYLNAATNLLDKYVAANIARMTLDLIEKFYKPPEGDKLLVYGMEMAGGVMAANCASLCPETHPQMLEWCDFVYVRKDRKKTGTCQQLEGPGFLTGRTKSSPLLRAVAVDDALSLGGSLRDSAKLLLDEYNCDLIGAIYIVDRSKDRKECPVEKLGMADLSICHKNVTAIYDLDEIDAVVQHIKRSRCSCACTKEQVMDAMSQDEWKDDYDCVLQACARNVKMGPWTATSGAQLEYYLNAATNLLDKSVGPYIARMTLGLIEKYFKPEKKGEKLLVYGMEMAGGVMAGQCATVCAHTHPQMLEWCDFVYVRKDRKKTGTCQQLEGPGFLTGRTKSSPPLNCLAVDDALSLGGSLRDSAKLMLEEYNCNCVGAIYIVDRSKDRKECPVEKLGMSDLSLRDKKVMAIYDLETVDKHVPRGAAGLFAKLFS